MHIIELHVMYREALQTENTTCPQKYIKYTRDTLTRLQEGRFKAFSHIFCNLSSEGKKNNINP